MPKKKSSVDWTVAFDLFLRAKTSTTFWTSDRLGGPQRKLEMSLLSATRHLGWGETSVPSDPKKLWAERDGDMPGSPGNLLTAEWMKSHSATDWTQTDTTTEAGRGIQSHAVLKAQLSRLGLLSQALSTPRDGNPTASLQFDHPQGNFSLPVYPQLPITTSSVPTRAHCLPPHNSERHLP